MGHERGISSAAQTDIGLTFHAVEAGKVCDKGVAVVGVHGRSIARMERLEAPATFFYNSKWPVGSREPAGVLALNRMMRFRAMLPRQRLDCPLPPRRKLAQ